jgi:hypothetical protein
VPDHPSIPPIEPAFTVEVEQLADEAYQALLGVEQLAARIGKVIEQYDGLTVGMEKDADIDQLRAVTGYERLLRIMYEMTGHAAAGADDPTVGWSPDWYQRLVEQRRQRLLQEMAGT